MKQHCQSKKHCCPLYSCFKELKTGQLLQQHVEQSHPELAQNGLGVDSNGQMRVSNKHLNKIIMICKMIPDFMKKEVFVQRTIRENKIKKQSSA